MALEGAFGECEKGFPLDTGWGIQKKEISTIP